MVCVLAVAGRNLDDFALGGLLFQLDLVTHDIDQLRRPADAGVLGQYFQPHHRVLGAADQVDDVVDTPADDIDHLAVVALADCRDAVSGLEPPVLFGGTAGHDTGNQGVLVLSAEQCADALERQLHRDLEILRTAR